MSLSVYPNQILGIMPNIVKTPEFSTLTPKSAAFVGPRIGQTRNPLWNFLLSYDAIQNSVTNPGNSNYAASELETLLGFNLANQGQLGEFLIDDPEDDTPRGAIFLAVPGSSGGSGFNVGDQLTVIGGLGTGAVLQVTTVSSGVITGLEVVSGGNFYSTTTNAQLVVLTGSGIGAPTANITVATQLQLIEDTSQPISAAAIVSGGSGFNAGDQLAVIGGGGNGAVLQVTTVSSGAITGLSVASGGTGYTTTSGLALYPLTGSGSGSPTANITAGPIWYSPLQRTIGSASAAQFQEDITDLNPQNYSGLQVWANGVLQTSGTNYAVDGPGLAIPGYSFMGLYLQWTAAPTGPIMAAFNWYFRVRFATDKTDFERFLYRLWTIGGDNQKLGTGQVKLVTARPLLA